MFLGSVCTAPPQGLSGAPTFDQMLRMFGKKSVNGEGNLWNRYMRGWVEATEKEYAGYQNALKTLDENVTAYVRRNARMDKCFIKCVETFSTHEPPQRYTHAREHRISLY